MRKRLAIILRWIAARLDPLVVNIYGCDLDLGDEESWARRVGGRAP